MHRTAAAQREQKRQEVLEAAQWLDADGAGEAPALIQALSGPLPGKNREYAHSRLLHVWTTLQECVGVCKDRAASSSSSSRAVDGAAAASSQNPLVFFQRALCQVFPNPTGLLCCVP